MKGKSAWKCVAVATVVAIAAGVQDFAEAADAPFGFVWSQKRESLPRPSSAQVDANITVLLYEGATLPPLMKDTATVSLKLCERYGLQQVRWASRLFGLSAVWLFRHVQDWRRP